MRLLVLVLALAACGPPPPPAEPEPPPAPDAAPPPPEVRRELPVGASPMSLVATAGALVWTDATGAIWTMPKAGPPYQEPRQLSDQHRPSFAFQLFAAGDRVRATSRGDVLDVDVTSGRVTKLGIALPEYPEAAVADAEYMYLTLFKRDQIVRVPVDGGPVHTLAELPRSILARHRTMLYAASYATGVLLAIPTRGGAQRVVARGLPRPTAMVADADHAYVYSETTKELLKVRLADGAVSTLARDLVNSDTLVLDGGHVYTRSWGKAKSVVRVAVDGSRPLEVIADGLATPYRIAVDATTIYATLRDGGRILVVPRSTLADAAR